MRALPHEAAQAVSGHTIPGGSVVSHSPIPRRGVSSRAMHGEDSHSSTRKMLAALQEECRQCLKQNGFELRPGPRTSRRSPLKNNISVGVDDNGKIGVALPLLDLTLPRAEQAIVKILGWRFRSSSSAPRRLADVLYVVVCHDWPVGIEVERQGHRPKVVVVRTRNVPGRELKKPIKEFRHVLRISVFSLDESAIAGIEQTWQAPGQARPEESGGGQEEVPGQARPEDSDGGQEEAPEDEEADEGTEDEDPEEYEE